MISIVIPTRNEATIIRGNLERLLVFLEQYIREEWRVIVADNASTDETRRVVREIAASEPRVELLELPEPGKGGAVLAAWKAAAASYQLQAASPHPPTPPLPEGGGENKKNSFSPSRREGEVEGVGNVHVFMDADLATDLAALPTLITAIRSGTHAAIGSRNLPSSRSERGIGRRAISWCYRLLLRLLFDLRVSDPPCGFKAVNERIVREIVPLVRDRQWFFDTELLIRAQRTGMRIAEIPVEWHEPRRGGSLRKVLRIIASDLRAMWRLRRKLRQKVSPPLTEGEREGVH